MMTPGECRYVNVSACRVGVKGRSFLHLHPVLFHSRGNNIETINRTLFKSNIHEWTHMDHIYEAGLLYIWLIIYFMDRCGVRPTGESAPWTRSEIWYSNSKHWCPCFGSYKKRWTNSAKATVSTRLGLVSPLRLVVMSGVSVDLEEAEEIGVTCNKSNFRLPSANHRPGLENLYPLL